jgi:hypothetical protein
MEPVQHKRKERSMSKNNLAFQKVDVDLKGLILCESKPSARKDDRLFAALDPKHAGYPPIESVLETVSDLQEPILLEAFQAMIGKGYEYKAAASKMIKTALFIIEINKRLHERRVALLSSVASNRDDRCG